MPASIVVENSGTRCNSEDLHIPATTPVNIYADMMFPLLSMRKLLLRLILFLLQLPRISETSRLRKFQTLPPLRTSESTISQQATEEKTRLLPLASSTIASNARLATTAENGAPRVNTTAQRSLTIHQSTYGQHS